MPAIVAGQDSPLRLTLEDVLARAQTNSQRVAELEARADAAAAAEAGRHAADMPLVALQGGYTRTNHVEEFSLPLRVLYPDAPDNYRARLDLQWPIYTGGRTDALERAARAEHQAATLDVAAARADLRLEATRAFWALVTADQAEDVLAHALESTDAHVRELRARLDQGLIPPNELLSAEAQRSRQQLLAIEARNLRGVAEADLRRVIGEDRRVPIEPVGAFEPSPGAPLDAQASAAAKLLESARARRPERKALDIRAAAGRDREAAAAAARLPQIALGAGYDYARPNPHIFPREDVWQDSWDVSVNVNWSLWDGGRRKADEADAAAGTRALVARASDFDRQLAFEVEQRRLELDSTHAAITTTEEGVRAAAEARRVVGERYAAGVATNTEVLDADTDLLQAELDRTRAIANARLALARLERAIGQ
jgi:outer membrane protein TolC